MASPAAYTFSSPTPSLPPSYAPALEEYGYGTPPPAYDFSMAAGSVFSSFSSSTTSRPVTSSGSVSSSSTRQSQTTDRPGAYGSTTSATTLTRMTRLVSLQVASDTPEDSVENVEVVKVTLISSVAGEFQTTVVTIQQAGAAASTEVPSQLALNDASNDDGGKDGSSLAGTAEDVANPSAESGDGAAFGAETPMPAMFVAAGVSERPDNAVMILVGFVVCVLYWAL
ncbi:hypothetical protein E4U41_004106 [Claviceps citrina]|nr:hypothetical protein E4U41_004106 [Claviceps citrina]